MGGHQIIGVVLAGGASHRFGADKATTSFQGTTLAAWAVSRLRPLVEEGLLEDLVLADRHRSLVAGVPSVPDGDGRGPAAGILGAAAASPRRTLLVLACDLPNVPVSLLSRLATRPASGALVPRHPNGDLEPLCARYGPEALARLAERVDQGEYSLHRWVRDLGDSAAFLDEQELEALGARAGTFLNVNRPEDLPGFMP